jgi:hypothetical protein
MHFFGHMRESAGEQELMRSLIQAGAVWYDVDARAYRRDLSGQFALEAWLPGADVTHDPVALDVDAILDRSQPTRISSINDLEQLGWQSVQGEVVLVPVIAAGRVDRFLAVAGPLEHEALAMLVEVCRAAGAVVEQLAERRAGRVRARLARSVGGAAGPFQASVRLLAAEYRLAVDAMAVRVGVMRPGQPRVTVCSEGEADWAESPLPPLEPGESELHAERMALGFAFGGGAGGVVEFLASPDQPFGVEQAQAALAGLEVLSVWLSGTSVGFARPQADRAPVPPSPPFEQAMDDALARARRLSLGGGVLVASVRGGGGPDPRVMSIVIRTVRAELRSADLLGQLAGGDIAAVLVRTDPDGVARAADRVRARLDALARERQVPPVAVGHTLYPADQAASPASLVEKARQQAGLTFS